MADPITEPADSQPIYTTGTIGDPDITVQEQAQTTFSYEETFSYEPRLRTVQTRVFRTDGLPGDDHNNFQLSQITVVE